MMSFTTIVLNITHSIFLVMLSIESISRLWNVQQMEIRTYTNSTTQCYHRQPHHILFIITSGVGYASLVYISYTFDYSSILLYISALLMDTSILYFNRPMIWYINTWTTPTLFASLFLLLNVIRPITG